MTYFNQLEIVDSGFSTLRRVFHSASFIISTVSAPLRVIALLPWWMCLRVCTCFLLFFLGGKEKAPVLWQLDYLQSSWSHTQRNSVLGSVSNNWVTKNRVLKWNHRGRGSANTKILWYWSRFSHLQYSGYITLIHLWQTLLVNLRLWAHKAFKNTCHLNMCTITSFIKSIFKTSQIGFLVTKI